MRFERVMVTGGAGYVGAVLVPQLIDAGYSVNVFDLYLYGTPEEIFGDYANHPRLTHVKGDIRDPIAVRQSLQGADAVIHLACISNDPSFELNPHLGRSINLDAFRPLVKASKQAGIKRFIYASSSSVYGVKENVAVTEDLSLEPLTDYSRFKADCEKILEEEREPGFVCTTVRPATVCGYSRRQRLDVIVNILTNHAVNNGKVKVMGGSQLRPNIHIQDMADLYLLLLDLPDEMVDGRIYNAGDENHSVMQLAEMVRSVVGGHVQLEVVPTNDPRSYHVSSEKIYRELGFKPKHTIQEAMHDLVGAMRDGKLPDSMKASRYFNINRMQEIKLS